MTSWKLKWHKITHWEYWPMEAVYYPIFPLWLYLAIKARSFFFFNAANPSIKNGGMAMESKMEIYDLIPNAYIPKTLLVQKQTSFETLSNLLQQSSLTFPIIAKPDIGMKAFGVEKLASLESLQKYQEKISHDFLVQELIEYPNEVGLFYVRQPHEKRGSITGIVSKEFLSVTGNGKDTITHLIKQNPRSHLQLPALRVKFGATLETILPVGQKFVLVPYGSHTRGAKFIDDTHRVNDKLVHTINKICTQIPGFFYGRLDILYTNFEDLAEGKNFKIIEINGAGSEATHIYDPKHSLFYAWREIYKHWRLLYQISVANKQNGHTYLSYKDGTAMLRANSLLEAQLKLM
ncbi:D-alanine--D-alanine ligase [Arenibacter sp. GZD96]|uniref:hypothetical protein n=1 Tax=Aurantibrevibacter litoralis TaxID=3106030 RepID=UPI002AFF6C47|nr:hypothetical protein [Arenibacter sp. GZD-96]MEA1786746.1 D-alanine--D-alanine ligase [Arenibacter sp. GZD-96]